MLLRCVVISTLICPTNWDGPGGGDTPAMSDYAGCHHDLERPIDVNNNGVLFLNSGVRVDEIADGAAHTILVGEKIADTDDGGVFDLGWASGTRATLRNTGTRLNAGVRGGLGRAMPAPMDWAQLEEQLGRGEEIRARRMDFEVMPIDPVDGRAPNSGDGAASGDQTPQTNVEPAPQGTPSGAADAPPLTVTIDDGEYAPIRGSLWVGGFASAHNSGANMLFGDGSVRFLSDLIDLQVYRRLGHRQDGQLLSDTDY